MLHLPELYFTVGFVLCCGVVCVCVLLCTDGSASLPVFLKPLLKAKQLQRRRGRGGESVPSAICLLLLSYGHANEPSVSSSSSLHQQSYSNLTSRVSSRVVSKLAGFKGLFHEGSLDWLVIHMSFSMYSALFLKATAVIVLLSG